MTITAEELVAIHPQLFHMAETGTWPSIREHGLLPTSGLLDLFGIIGDEKRRIQQENRRGKVVIEHPTYGAVTIRDQIPMTDSALEKCLVKMKPREWHELLNGRVFFWTSNARLKRLLNARAYRNQSHCIITVDTKSFLEDYHAEVELSPINSGSTIFKPQPRGKDTFLPLAEFPFEQWRQKRSRRNIVVEVTVPGGVRNITDYVVEVCHMRGDTVLDAVYRKK